MRAATTQKALKQKHESVQAWAKKVSPAAGLEGQIRFTLNALQPNSTWLHHEHAHEIKVYEYVPS